MDRREFIKSMMLVNATVMTALTAAGCNSGQSSRSANISSQNLPRLMMMYLPCTLSKQFMHPYNAEVDYTPNISEFAAESALFNKHQTEAGQTGICFASMLSGNHADKHGVYRHPRMVSDEVYLLSEALMDAGYEVFFWIKHKMVRHKLNYSQGIAEENKITDHLNAEIDPLYKSVVARAAADPDYKVAILTVFTLSHSPYAHPNRLVESDYIYTDVPRKRLDKYHQIWKKLAANNQMTMIGLDFDQALEKRGLRKEKQKAEFVEAIKLLYIKSMKDLDAHFGSTLAVLKENGIYDESLVLFAADHGETFHRNNALFRLSHGYQLCPHSMSVPMMLRAPSAGVIAGEYDNVSRTVDIMPTVAHFAGLELNEDLKIDGVNLGPAISGKTDFPELLAFSHTSMPWLEFNEMHPENRYFNIFFNDNDPGKMWVMLRDGDIVYKYAAWNKKNPIVEQAVFDLSVDPDEDNNIYNEANPVHQQMMAELGKYRHNLVEAYPYWEKIHEGTIDPEEAISALKDLGYI